MTIDDIQGLETGRRGRIVRVRAGTIVMRDGEYMTLPVDCLARAAWDEENSWTWDVRRLDGTELEWAGEKL